MTAIAARPGRADRPSRPPGRPRLPGGQRRLEPAVRPRSGGDRLRPGDPGRRQRAGLGAAERRPGPGAQRPALPGGLVQRRRRHRDRRQRAEVGDDRHGVEHRDRRRRAQPVGSGDRARRGRLRGADRHRRDRRVWSAPRSAAASDCSPASFGMAWTTCWRPRSSSRRAPTGPRRSSSMTQNNSDLLWALRGAGNGNFGIVTSLTYTVHPLTQTVYVTATWPGLGDLHGVFDAWQRCAPHTDNRLTSQLEIHPDEIMLFGVLAAGSEARGHAAAGADPVGRQSDVSDDRTRAGPTSTPASRSRPRTSPRTGSSSRSSSPSRSRRSDRRDRLVHVEGAHAGLQLLHQRLRRSRRGQ